jgi:hypothetical protein
MRVTPPTGPDLVGAALKKLPIPTGSSILKLSNVQRKDRTGHHR